MPNHPSNVRLIIQQPVAFIPILMSLAALAVLATAVALYGAHWQPDEGAAAHIFQLLIVGQLPLVAALALRSRQSDIKAVVGVLGLQAAAATAALLPVFVLGL